MSKPIKGWKIMVTLLAGVTGLFVTAYLALRLPEDPVVRYHDTTPFRAYFRVTSDTWPLAAQAVHDRFGAPNRYSDGGHFPWDLTTRVNSKWVYRMKNGGRVILHVADGNVTHAYIMRENRKPSEYPLEFFRPAPREQAGVAR